MSCKYITPIATTHSNNICIDLLYSNSERSHGGFPSCNHSGLPFPLYTGCEGQARELNLLNIKDREFKTIQLMVYALQLLPSAHLRDGYEAVVRRYNKLQLTMISEVILTFFSSTWRNNGLRINSKQARFLPSSPEWGLTTGWMGGIDDWMVNCHKNIPVNMPSFPCWIGRLGWPSSIQWWSARNR